MPLTRMPPGRAPGGEMARTSVSWEALRELAAFRARTGCAVSFYLDLDPHATPTAAAAQTRTRALIDEAHKRAESTRSRRSHQQQASIRAGLERIKRYFDGEFEREGVRGVAVFAAAKDDLWRPLPLPAPVGDAVKFGSELYVTPLVPVAADGNAALVAVVGRERGDLYELRDGRLGPISSRFEEQPRRHDQGGWSQANYQRHVDDLAGKHLRGVAEELERALRRRRNAPLALACSEEARTEFLGLLSAEERARRSPAGRRSKHTRTAPSCSPASRPCWSGGARSGRRSSSPAGTTRWARAAARPRAGSRRSRRPPTVASTRSSTRRTRTRPSIAAPPAGGCSSTAARARWTAPSSSSPTRVSTSSSTRRFSAAARLARSPRARISTRSRASARCFGSS